MKFSPIFLAAVMAAAVYCAACIGGIIPLAAAAILFVLYVIIAILSRKLDFVILLFIAGAMIGITSFMVSSSTAVHKTVNYEKKYVTLYGVIISPAQESNSSDNYSYTFLVKEIMQNDNIISANEHVLLTTPNKYNCGDTIKARGIIKPLPEKMNEYGFNTAANYKSQNIFTRIYTKDIEYADDIIVISPFVICGKFRELTDRLIYQYYYGDSAAILSAVLTGNNHRFSDDYKTAVSSTAFRRLFHPAFIHIMLFTSFIGMFAALIPRRIREIALMTLLIIYAVLNCAHIGFVRCIASCALMYFFRCKNESAYYHDAIAWIVIITCAASPMLLFNAGFILSITAGVIIWAFTPHISKLFGTHSGFFKRLASVMIVCAVFYTPITSVYFNGICIYSFLLPFVMTPVVIITLLCSGPVFVMMKLFNAAPVFKGLLDFMIWIMKTLPSFISSLPFSSLSFGTPSPSELLTLIFLLFASYYILKNRSQKALITLIISAGMGCASLISFMHTSGTTTFTFVNVGQGDGSLIHTAQGASVIIDGGGGSSYSDYDPGQVLFVPYLTSHGISAVDAAFVSHLHKDHVQGILDTIKSLNVKHVFIPEPAEGDEEMSEWKATLENAASERKTCIHYITENTRITFEKGLILDIYVPDDIIKLSKNSNDSSLLIKASYGNINVLYTGDMTSYSEKQFLRLNTDVSAEVLKVGHHGASTSSCPEWIDAVAPQYSVISCGENNTYGHPAKQTLENLSGTEILRTDINGDIRITADKTGIKEINTLNRR